MRRPRRLVPAAQADGGALMSGGRDLARVGSRGDRGSGGEQRGRIVERGARRASGPANCTAQRSAGTPPARGSAPWRPRPTMRMPGRIGGCPTGTRAGRAQARRRAAGCRVAWTCHRTSRRTDAPQDIASQPRSGSRPGRGAGGRTTGAQDAGAPRRVAPCVPPVPRPCPAGVRPPRRQPSPGRAAGGSRHAVAPGAAAGAGRARMMRGAGGGGRRALRADVHFP